MNMPTKAVKAEPKSESPTGMDVKRIMNWAEADAVVTDATNKSMKDRGIVPYLDWKTIGEAEPVNVDIVTTEPSWIAAGKFGDRIAFKGKVTVAGKIDNEERIIAFKVDSRPAKQLTQLMKTESGVAHLMMIRMGEGQQTRYTIRKRAK